MEKKYTSVKSKKRVKDFGEVFTPPHIVKDMCATIPDDVWDKIGSTFLEPTCGNGNFLVEILNRKLDRCKDDKDCLIALNSIYAIDILSDNVREAKERMLEIFADCCGREKEAREILDSHIICGDSLEIMRKLEEGYEWGEW